MSDIAISVENLSKMYRLGEVGTGTISHDLNRWWHKARGKEDPYLKLGEVNARDSKGGNYVWALKDVSFDVKQGNVLGVIGKNGAGKSTLLKLLSRVTAPSTGIIKAKGRIASLLEVGTGFHPELTGRENIFLNGAIMGMTKPEIRKKFDEIVDFSGVERYIDTPVKRYSSGMYVRLAFAVAAFLEPEILIVDEVLAVGDAEFQKKCLGRMKDVSVNDGRTVLFVSHNMGAIKSLCKETLLLEKGNMSFIEPTSSAIEKYLSSSSDVDRSASWTGDERPGDSKARLEYVNIVNETGNLNRLLTSEDDVHINVGYELLSDLKNFRVAISLQSYEGENIFETSDFFCSDDTSTRVAGKYESKLIIPKQFLNASRYYISLYLEVAKEQPSVSEVILSFTISELMRNDLGLISASKPPGIIHPILDWNVKRLQ